MYKCSECPLAVIVIDGQAIRACAHIDAPIIAEMSAVMEGVGVTAA
jgi:hypothetical protein